MAGTIILNDNQAGAASDSEQFHRRVERLYPDSRIFLLDCNFARAGVWGGLAELLESLWPALLKDAKDLIQRHVYELARVVPWLIEAQFPIPRTLTDAAPATERVRSYAADRALRTPHGVIDLLLACKRRTAPTARWIICGYDYGSAGSIAQLFYRELQRRAPNGSGIQVVLGSTRGHADEPIEEGRDANGLHGLQVVRTAPSTPLASPEEASHALGQVDQIKAPLTPSLIQQLPRLIQLAQAYGPAEKAILLRLIALSHYTAEGLYQDALRYADGLLDESIASLPANQQLHWTIAYKVLNARMGAGKIEEAFALATGECPRLVAPAGKHAHSNLLYLQAMLYARFQQPRNLPRGEELLREAIEILDPQEMSPAEYHFARVFLRNGLAMIRVFQKRHAEALALCQAGMREMNQYLQPAEHLLHRSVLTYNVAQVYGSVGETEQAIQYMSQAIRMDPNYSEYYNERGNLYLAQHHYQAAIEDYEAAIRLSPPYPEVFVNLAQCHRLQGHYETAIAFYDRALDLRPATLLARVGRGSCLHLLGRSSEALLEYSEVLALDQSSWEIYANRAAIYYDLDRFQEALQDLDQAIRLNPGQPALLENRELLYLAAASSIN